MNLGGMNYKEKYAKSIPKMALKSSTCHAFVLLISVDYMPTFLYFENV